ncbi:hypothetical protein IWW55_002809, partial [Coemansia sp. RSA 2706]
MKFGKYLEAEQVPEWAKMYADYHGLKRQIKAVAAAMARQQLQQRHTSAERMSLIRRASTYLGYDSIQTGASPLSSDSASLGAAAQTGGAASTSSAGLRSRLGSCASHGSEAGCSHFGNIVSATPQIAMTMSAGNSGKVAATPAELAQRANIKIPLSAQDSFTEGIRMRRSPVASHCVSA